MSHHQWDDDTMSSYQMMESIKRHRSILHGLLVLMNLGTKEDDPSLELALKKLKREAVKIQEYIDELQKKLLTPP